MTDTTPTEPSTRVHGEEAVEIVARAIDPAPWRSEHPGSLAAREVVRDKARASIAALSSAGLLATEQEWGVRFPSGSVQSFGEQEDRARQFSLNANGLRPDLPTLVVRKAVTTWLEA